MEFRVFRDFKAIRFIRVQTAIPGLTYAAAGAGMTLGQAIARCESEMIERQIEVHELRANGIIPVGIAAHLTYDEARDRALQECVETLCLEQIHSEKVMRCLFRLQLRRFTLGLTRTSLGYFCFMRGFLGDSPIGAYSAAPTVFSTLLKAWEEYQCMHFFKPKGAHLKKFTKAHKLFSNEELKSLPLQFEPRFVYNPNLSGLTSGSAERSGRVIVYYVNKKEGTEI